MGRAYLPEAWVRDANVSPQTRCLAALLSSYADAEHGDQDVWPSPETLAKSLGMSKRNITRLGDEGQAAGWWTRIYERNFRGGVELTWRLHFPAFSANGHRSDTEATPMSPGRNHSANTNGAQQTTNGHRADTEATPMSAGRYEGTTVRRDEVDSAFALTQTYDGKPKREPPKKERAPKPKREVLSRPTTDDVFNALVAKGMPPTIAERESDKFCGYYEANGWRVGRNPMKSWKGAVATWYRNWQERNPQQAGVQQRPALTQLDRNGRVRDM